MLYSSCSQGFCLIGSALLAIVSVAACTDGDPLPVKRTLDAAVGTLPVADASAKPDESLDASRVSVAIDGGLHFEPLIDNQGWRRYDAAADPLPSHQPAVLSCAASATFLEYGSFEVDTTRCNYLLSEHPAQLAIAAGTQVKLELLHYDLSASEPAQAHIALLFGDALQWETSIPIPRAGDVIKANFQATKALALDEPIRLHLHNHGGNTYLVVALQAAAAPPAAAPPAAAPPAAAPPAAAGR
jgi:hypothetical protein